MYKLRKIRLNNFQCYKEKEVFFDYDNFLLAGKNGSGKTSLLIDSIYFCLFGGVRTGTIDEIILEGTDIAEVTVDFINRENVIFRCTRKRIRGEKTTLCIYTIDNNIEQDISCRLLAHTQEKIALLLGISRETFLATVVYQQGSSNRFCSCTNTERKEFLYRVLDLGLFDKCLDNVRKKIRKCENEKAGYVLLLKEFDNRDIINIDEEEFEELKVIIDFYNIILSSNNIMKKQLVVIHDNYMKKKRELEQFINVNELAYALINAERDKKYSDIVELQNSISNNIVITDDDIESRVEDLYLLIEDSKENRNKCLYNIESIGKENKILEGDIGGACPVCKKELEEIDKKNIITSNNNNIRILKENVIGYEKLIVDVTNDINYYNSYLKDKDIANDIQIGANIINNFDIEKRSILDIIEVYKEDLYNLNIYYESINSKNEKILEQEILYSKDREHKIIDFNKIIFNKEQQEKNNVLIEEYKKEVIDLDIILKRLYVLEKAFGVNGIRVYVLENNIDYLESKINYYLNEFSFSFTVNFVFCNEALKEVLELTFFNGETKRLFDTFSAGEKRLIELSVFLGLRDLQVNNQLDIIIFDEIFDSLDENNIDVVYDNVLKKLNFQLLLISHNMNLIDRFKNSLILEKEI